MRSLGSAEVNRGVLLDEAAVRAIARCDGESAPVCRKLRDFSRSGRRGKANLGGHPRFAGGPPGEVASEPPRFVVSLQAYRRKRTALSSRTPPPA